MAIITQRAQEQNMQLPPCFRSRFLNA
jgi:hypothetical protein